MDKPTPALERVVLAASIRSPICLEGKGEVRGI